MRESREKQLSEVSRSQVNKDVELQTLKENEDRLKSDLQQRKQDVER